MPVAPQPPATASPGGRGGRAHELFGVNEGALTKTDAAPRRVEAAGRLTAVLLVAALAAAAIQQGGFFARGQIPVAALLVAALLSAFPLERAWDPALRLPFAIGGLAVAWALARALPSGSLRSAAGEGLLLAALALVVVLAGRLDAPARRVALAGMLGTGVILAATAWAGMAWRITPWALTSEGLWRGASTITYANATGCVLAALALTALALLGGARRSLLLSLLLALLLLGLATTLSRAAALAFLVGLSVLVLLRGPGVLRALAVPFAGAFVAFLCLAPSMPVSSEQRPLLATGGLVLGFALVAGIMAGGRRGLVVAGVAALIFVVGAGTRVVAAGSLGDAGSRISSSRLQADSPARARLHAAALDLVAGDPLVGVGPGRFVRESRAHGRLRVQQYVHDEYGQLLVEQGAIGAALGAALLLSVARLLWRCRSDAPERALWAGTVAAFAAVAVQSGFDFVWHVPIVLLCLAFLLGLVVKPAASTSEAA